MNSIDAHQGAEVVFFQQIDKNWFIDLQSTSSMISDELNGYQRISLKVLSIEYQNHKHITNLKTISTFF